MSASSFSTLFLKPLIYNHSPQFPICYLATQTKILTLCATSSHESDVQNTPLDAPSPSTKNTLAVSLGMCIIRLTSQFIKSSKTVAKVFISGKSTKCLKTDNYFLKKDPIATVMEDPLDHEGIIWGPSVKGVVTEREHSSTDTLGFSFSAAGLLFPYHLGVANFLIEKGYIKDTTPLAGSSAGAIVCAVIASGSSMQEALKATKILAEDCRLKGTAFRLGAVLRDVLVKFLPDDIHIRSNGRVRVAITQVLWRPRCILVDEFDSKEDLINAVITSSFIPGYLAPRPATMFRNRLCIDGGLTQFMPPADAEQTVRVCPFPSSQLGFQGIGISPDRNPINRATPRELLNWALGPADDEILDRLFEAGNVDAAVWADENPIQNFISV